MSAYSVRIDEYNKSIFQEWVIFHLIMCVLAYCVWTRAVHILFEKSIFFTEMMFRKSPYQGIYSRPT